MALAPITGVHQLTHPAPLSLAFSLCLHVLDIWRPSLGRVLCGCLPDRHRSSVSGGREVKILAAHDLPAWTVFARRPGSHIWWAPSPQRADLEHVV